MTQPLVEIVGLQTHFPVRQGLLRRQVGAVRAVDGVSFSIGNGSGTPPWALRKAT